jgi:hypothetical protein
MGYCNLPTGCGGYAFAYSDSMGTPPPATPGSSSATLGMTGVCITGTVGSVGNPPQYSVNWGCGVGFNIDQAMGANPPANTVVLPGAGITVSTSAVPACTTARVILDNNGTDYCATLTPGVMIPWGSFNTTCWAPATGTYMAGAPTSAKVRVQFVTAAAACPYSNFCITGVQL